MFFVLRNGEYLETEQKIFGDIPVPKRPHPHSIFINGEWVINADSYFAEADKTEAQEFLNQTDWKIIRHKEQQDLGIETSLSNEEYLSLIAERQERRAILNDIVE